MDKVIACQVISANWYDLIPASMWYIDMKVTKSI